MFFWQFVFLILNFIVTAEHVQDYSQMGLEFTEAYEVCEK